ncbi:efflux RND transporter periplasmic adaptor subunit [Paraperlucidibaca sp.]|jgi:membrane fusion protein (multidrug efflux system)|uniref:efflux RND transporter periplasmic adaptor subunit n=1 Tax=Paraperlucidibaca sp. TaxID=2708021 RepID=UPI001B3E3A29|nr:efflux RND transporter periplasmic adaptor subunit [Paraperlucidibaca sp.]
MMQRLPYLASALVLSSLLSACGSQEAPASAPPPAEVGIITLKAQAIDLTTTLPGRVTAFQTAEVRPQVGGIVKRRVYAEGTEVKAGSVLYELDPATYQAAYASASASLAKANALAKQAKLIAKRYEGLVAIKAVSQQENDDAQASAAQTQADVALAKAALDKARIELNYTRITSPISGRSGKSSVTAGALLTANQVQALTTVVQLDPIYVDMTQSSSDFLALKRAIEQGGVSQGKRIPVTLTLSDGRSYEHIGSVAFSESTVDPSTNSITLRAQFPNPSGQLLPGLFVQAKVVQGQQQGVLAPQRALSRNPQGDATAMVLDQDNKVQPRVVKTSRAIGDKWQVIEGLEAGDRLIVDGLQRAKPGSVVEPVPFTGDQVIAPAQVESEKTDSSSNTPSVAKKAE